MDTRAREGGDSLQYPRYRATVARQAAGSGYALFGIGVANYRPIRASVSAAPLLPSRGMILSSQVVRGDARRHHLFSFVTLD